jgi:hypothetical protein
LIGFANRGRPPQPPQQSGEAQDQFAFDGRLGIKARRYGFLKLLIILGIF